MIDKIIELSNLEKYYTTGDDKVLVLKGLGFSVVKGEFVAIMGASGSGKSTLMNILGLLDLPTNGTYYLSGKNVSELSRDQQSESRNKFLGFVFQGFNLLPRLTIEQNVALPLVYAGIDYKLHKNKTDMALQRVGLSQHKTKFPPQLSGGQQQRVAIARALINNPSLILADEPTGNLDTKTSHEIMELFQELNDEGVTILLITHEQDIANGSKRIIKLIDGAIGFDREISQIRASSLVGG